MNAAEVSQARKLLPLLVPVAVLVVLGFGVLFIPDWLHTVDDLIAGAPVVRIGWADPLALVVLPLVLTVLVSVVLRAIPAGQRWWPALARCNHLLLGIGAVLLFIVLPAARFAENAYMPQRGYTKCDALKGHPTLWFNDWVRNPDWCVQGKDLDWVRQQAAAPAPPTPSPSTGHTAAPQ